jgi:PfaD family protein
LGAAFVATGSVNQAAVESGVSPRAKQMLAAAGMADVIMAPAADMFEMGVKVQVLRKGTMFAQRAARLYDVYREHASLESLSPALVAQLERDIFRRGLADVWEETTRFFARRNPAQLTAALNNPKIKLALICRWYLGQSSRWAITGEEGREMDFQIWCGPAQGAFNQWAKGSFLEPLENRSVAQIAFNLLEGAAVAARAQQLRAMGVPTPNSAFRFAPRPLA